MQKTRLILTALFLPFTAQASEQFVSLTLCSDRLLIELAKPSQIAAQSPYSKNLTTASIPDPDLLIRTGGELRISNYLLWQIAYSELYFCDTFWPDFNEAIGCMFLVRLPPKSP